jgi:hypothetical protein
MRDGGINENDGGAEFNCDVLVTTFDNVTMYPQHNKKNF